MLARCPSDDHQLLYSPERLNDVIELKHRVEFNVMYITDIMRACKRDNPASKLESGQHKKRRLLLLAMSTICLKLSKHCP